LVALPESAIAILNHPQTFAHVVTLNRDGSPHVTVVWVETVDGVISFNTARGRQKAVNLERDARIAVSVQDPENPAVYMAFHCRARLIDDDTIDQIHRLSRRYTGRDFDGLQEGVARVRVDVDVEQITGYTP
jgi:PPOX class probable F420-dependent enzyme